MEGHLRKNCTLLRKKKLFFPPADSQPKPSGVPVASSMPKGNPLPPNFLPTESPSSTSPSSASPFFHPAPSSHPNNRTLNAQQLALQKINNLVAVKRRIQNLLHMDEDENTVPVDGLILGDESSDVVNKKSGNYEHKPNLDEGGAMDAMNSITSRSKVMLDRGFGGNSDVFSPCNNFVNKMKNSDEDMFIIKKYFTPSTPLIDIILFVEPSYTSTFKHSPRSSRVGNLGISDHTLT
ncbi:hypothetical protein SUGI_0345290 [Cryptomeria japonica]|nr:hypothetical protein SUGI_0345290 [Cryptomeria japonica]